MAKVICRSCGNIGQPKSITEGSFLIELILWLAFLIPGLIYSIWRLCNRYHACSLCGSKDIIPVDSPIGIKMMEGKDLGHK